MADIIVRSGNTIVKNWATVARGLTFAKYTSTPENWRYTGRCQRVALACCELCQTLIVYRYELKHKINNHVLWIGSECIKWYYESWQPNGLEELLLAMQKDARNTKKQYVAEKLEKWRVAFPVFYDYLLGPERRGYYNKWLKCVEEGQVKTFKVSAMRASLRNKGYLNCEELTKLVEGLKTNGIFAYAPEQLETDYSLIGSFIDVFKPVRE